MKFNDNNIKHHATNVMSLLTIFLLSFLIFFYLIISSSSTIPDGFVYVRDIIPDIQISLRYASNENFQGHIVNGYLANVSILTRAAALNLKQAQNLAKKNGYELVIYDGYRPQKSVDQYLK
jgi:D-alanyl-D-alanine dipeptidase